jgi:mRNA interferase RelE/StbE
MPCAKTTAPVLDPLDAPSAEDGLTRLQLTGIRDHRWTAGHRSDLRRRQGQQALEGETPPGRGGPRRPLGPRNLGAAVRAQDRRTNHPPANRAGSMPAGFHESIQDQAARYKTKLRSIGYRLVYEVRNAEFVARVVAVGRRERNAAYRDAAKRQ